MAGRIELLIDDSNDSDEARRLFDEAGIDYKRIWAKGPRLPTAYHDHIGFPELSGIHTLIDMLTKRNLFLQKD